MSYFEAGATTTTASGAEMIILVLPTLLKPHFLLFLPKEALQYTNILILKNIK